MRNLGGLFQRLLTEENKVTKRWRTFAGILAVIVTFTTTYSLILPAITVSNDQVEEVAGLYPEDDGFMIVEDNDDYEEVGLEQDHNTPVQEEDDTAGVLIEDYEEETETEPEGLITETGEETETAAEIEADIETEVETEAESETAETEAIEIETEVKTAETETVAETETEVAATAETKSESETETETETGVQNLYPEQTFIADDNGIHVVVTASEGAFPEGTTMTVSGVEDEKTLEGIEEKVLTEHNRISRVQAIDICFRDAKGTEIEPKVPVRVCMITESGSESENATVVHVDDSGNAEAIDDVSITTSGDKDRILLTKEGANEEEADQEEVMPLNEEPVQNDKDEYGFEAGQFSVYAIVYTVDFHWDVNGKTYEYSLAGGAAIGLRALLPALHVTADDPDTEKDEIATFVDDIASVVFSDDTLVMAAKVEEDTTAGALKATLGIDSVYSDELAQEDIDLLDCLPLAAGDWALISLKPFDTPETLTITMNDSEVFTIEVTDAQISTQVMTADGKTWHITLTYGPGAQIPEGAFLRAEEVAKNTVEYYTYLSAAQMTLCGEVGYESPYARFFDIEIRKDGLKIEPASPVRVSIVCDDAPETEDKEEQLKVVHFEEDGPVAMEILNENREEVQFQTDSFSVYGVLSTSGDPSDVNSLNGRAFTISYNDYYMTAERMDAHGLGCLSSAGQNDAAVWQFETTGESGKYYIYTIVDGSKQYLNMERSGSTSYASSVLGSEPQAFTVTRNGNSYRLSAVSQSKTFYLDCRDGGNFNHSYSGLTNGEHYSAQLTLTPATTQPVAVVNDTYAVIIKDHDTGKYYAVQNDGSLVEVEYSEENNTARVKIDYPLMWTYTSAHDGKSDDTMGSSGTASNTEPYNIRVSVDCRHYNSFQLPEGNYYRYLSPLSKEGIYTEGKEEDDLNPSHGNENGENNYLNGGAKWYNGLKYENNTLYDIHKQGDSYVSTKQYIGADFNSLHVTGQNTAENAATVFLSKIETIPNVGSNNETVSHIDIAVKGQGVLDMPLAYGTYYDEHGNPILTVEKGDFVTLHLNQEVDFDKDDIMAATITAYNKNGEELNDAFYITGYTANDTSGDSAVQVRMEGSFKVDTLDPYPNQSSPASANLDENRRSQRLDNQVYYKLSTMKDVRFDLVYNGQQLYDKNHNKLTTTAKVKMSSSFNYWNPDNECPPLLPRFESRYHLHPNKPGDYPDGFGRAWWESGAIVDNNQGTWTPQGDIFEYYNLNNPYDRGYGLPGDSGMDFVLGSKDDSNDKTLAVEIIKIIENEDGERIHPAREISNDFSLYYNASALPSEVRMLAVDEPVTSESLSSVYTGYNKVLDTSVVVGSDGIGIGYDYDVEPGMFYVTEDSASMGANGENQQITDTNGNVWTYVETRVETEYVWRDNEYNGKCHTAEGYSGVPEVLGDYLDDKGKDQRNGFLEFYIYNVYKAEPTNLKVEKKWEGGDIPESASVEMMLKRYKLAEKTPVPNKGRVTVTQEFNDLNNVRADENFSFTAVYVLRDVNGQEVARATKNNADYTSVAFDTALDPGNYTVEYTFTTDNGHVATTKTGTQWVTLPVTESTTVNAGEISSVSFETTLNRKKEDAEYHVVYLHATEEQPWVAPNEGGHRYILKRYIEYKQGQQVTLEFMGNGNPFWHYDSGHHVWIRHGNGNAADLGEIRDDHTRFTFTVDGPIEIWVSDTTLQNYNNILSSDVAVFSPGGTLVDSPQGAGRSAVGRFMAANLLGAGGTEPSITMSNPGSLPTPPENMEYVVDSWEYTVTLSDEEAWTKLLEGSEVPGLVKTDADGNQYWYYIDSIEEYGLPDGSVAKFALDGENVLAAQDENTTLSVTNTVPVKAQIKGTKIMNGATDNYSGFSFTLTPVSGAPMPGDNVTAAAVSAADGSFSFDEITYTPAMLAGETADGNGVRTKAFTYKVTEIVPAPAVTDEERGAGYAVRDGIRYDLSEKTVTVTVSYKEATGEMSASVSPAGTDVVFRNEEVTGIDVRKIWMKADGTEDTSKTGDITFTLIQTAYTYTVENDGTVTRKEPVENTETAYTGSYMLKIGNSAAEQVENDSTITFPSRQTASVSELPKFGTAGSGNSEQRVLYVYSVRENAIEGYTGLETEDSEGNWIITNRPKAPTDENTTLQVTKEWKDASGAAVPAQLKADSSIQYVIRQRIVDTGYVPVTIILVEYSIRTGSRISAEKTIYVKKGTDFSYRIGVREAISRRVNESINGASSTTHRARTNLSYSNSIRIDKPTSITETIPSALDGSWAFGNPWSADSVDWLVWYFDYNGTADKKETTQSLVDDFASVTTGSSVDTETYKYNMTINNSEPVTDGVGEVSTQNFVASFTKLPLTRYIGTSCKTYYYTIDEIEVNGKVVVPADSEISQPHTDEYYVNVDGNTITNTERPGALKITKAVSINGIVSTDTAAEGTYSFNIYKADGTSPATKKDGTTLVGTQTIVIENGLVTQVNGESVDQDHGFILVNDLAPGDYVIEEVEPVNGTVLKGISGGKEYTADTTSRRVTVTVKAGDIRAQEASAAVLFTNDKTINIEINILKVDKTDEDRHLKNAWFRLEKYADDTYRNPEVICEEEVSSESGKEGTLKIENLEPGYYKLIETKSPAGYVKTGEDPCFQIRANAETGLLEVVFENSDMVTYTGEDKTFIVRNQPGSALPSTGGPGTRLFTILGSILAAGAGLLLWRRRRLILQ